MDKVERPRGLIRWDTLARQQGRERGDQTVPWRPLRPRTLLYGALLSAVVAIMLAAFALRSDVDLSAQRDRSPNFVRLSDGDIRNAYAVKVSNKRQQDRQYRLSVRGLTEPSIAVTNVDDRSTPPKLAVRADSVGTFRVLVTLARDKAPAGSIPIEFVVADERGSELAVHESVFVGPNR